MALSSASILEWLLGVDSIQEIKQGYAVIVSSTIVVIGWYFTRLGQIKSDRVKNTASFVGVLRDKELAEARQLIAPIVNNYRQFVYANDEVSRGMVKILIHLEYQSASVRLGLISEKFINKTEKTFINTVFTSCSVYMDGMRKARKSKTIFENLEAVFIRAYVGQRNPFISVIEYVTASPRFELSLIDFRVKYFLARSIYSLKENYMEESWEVIRSRLIDLERMMGFIIILIILFIVFTQNNSLI